MNEVVGLEPQSAPRFGNLEFVFWRHIKENVGSVSDAVYDADVILLETSPTMSKSDKRIEEAMANAFLGAELTSRQAAILDRQLGEDAALLHYDPRLDGQLADMLKPDELAIVKVHHGSGKIIHHLDTNPQDQPEVVAEIRASEAIMKDINDRTAAGEAHFQDNINAMHQIMEYKGSSLRRRDEVIVEQIKQQLEIFPDKKIVVLFGHNHTAISHEFLRSGATRRFLADTLSPSAKKGQSYSLDSQAERSARFNKPISDELLERIAFKAALVQRMMMADGTNVDPETLNAKMRSFDSYSLMLSDRAANIARVADATQLARFVQLSIASSETDTSEANRAMWEFLGQATAL